ncbi:MAG: hypothetical protein BGO78_09745 [Chloroflexi bacterium 44-23]|nr:MAG: hypothetical protein BGO78_09745 [Chloroflexi bacterium 44-23]
MEEQPLKHTLNKRLENISWGAFLILIGGLWLIPDRWIPEGAWLIAAGVTMLGLNLARKLNGIRMSGFTFFLGTIALFSGIADILAINLPLMPILLILVGASILLKPYFEKNTAAEEDMNEEE